MNLEEVSNEQNSDARFTPWLNAGEAAVYIGMGENTFRSRVKAGRIKRYFIDEGRRRPRFHVNDLDDFVRRGGRGFAS